MIGPAFDKDEVRRRVPLAAVCQVLGVRLDYEGRGLCPFHENDGLPHAPSFSLWTDPVGIQRWGCFPCGLSGDSFDLVQRLEKISFGDAIRRVAVVGEANIEVKVEPPVKVELDEISLRVYVESAQRSGAALQNHGLLCVAAGMRSEDDDIEGRLELDTVLRQLGWGVDDQANVVVPHYDNYRLCGAKIRSPDGHRWAFPGSSFEELYGTHLGPVEQDQVLLVEGETDFAHVLYAKIEARPLALPSGAGRILRSWVDAVSSSQALYLGLDADEAGDRATEKWIEAMGMISPETELRVLQIPRGEDLRSCEIAVSYLVASAPIVRTSET